MWKVWHKIPNIVIVTNFDLLPHSLNICKTIYARPSLAPYFESFHLSTDSLYYIFIAALTTESCFYVILRKLDQMMTGPTVPQQAWTNTFAYAHNTHRKLSTYFIPCNGPLVKKLSVKLLHQFFYWFYLSSDSLDLTPQSCSKLIQTCPWLSQCRDALLLLPLSFLWHCGYNGSC